MITKFIHTTTGKLRISIPESINELKVSQLLAIQECENITDVKVLSILSGVAEELIWNISDIRELSKFNERVRSLMHQIAYCYNETAIPEFVIIGTKTRKILGYNFERDNKIKVLKNLSIAPAGAFMACRDLISDEINKHINIYGEESWEENFVPAINVCAELVGHYLYCEATGLLYNETKAEAFKSEIVKLPVQTVLPIARYFFLNYQNLSSTKMKFCQALRATWNARLVSKRLKNSRTSTR